MGRRPSRVDLDGVVAEALEGGGDGVEADAATEALLDAVGVLLARHGTGRWSMDDVAERAGLARATVYRRFASRGQLVRAALVRDARRFFAAVTAAVGEVESLEDKVVLGFEVGLREARRTLLPILMESDPAAALSLLTSSELLSAATLALVERYRALAPGSGSAAGGDQARKEELMAETLVRLGLSHLMVPTGRFTPGDLRAVLAPLLGGASSAAARPPRPSHARQPARG